MTKKQDRPPDSLDAVVELKSAMVEGGVRLRFVKLSVNYEYRPMRNNIASGWLSVEPDGAATFTFPVEGDFSLQTVSQMISVFLSQISKATVKVVNELESPGEF